MTARRAASRPQQIHATHASADRTNQIKARVAASIERELARCRQKMGDDAWRLHGDWVRDYVVTGAKTWLQQQAIKGAL